MVVDSLHNQFIISNNCKLPFFGGNIYNLTKFCQENDLSNLGEGDFNYSFIWFTTAKKQPPNFLNNFVSLIVNGESKVFIMPTKTLPQTAF